MGYRKIPNLYDKRITQAILGLGECYALEKIHGTSAHISVQPLQGPDDSNGIRLFPGGIKYDDFLALFIAKYSSLDNLRRYINGAILLNASLDYNSKVVIYGEAYGGKCQKMTEVYGPLNFIAFEVAVTGSDGVCRWLDVPSAAKFANLCLMDFVAYERGPSTLEWLDGQRDRPSTQAARNGMGEKFGEGIVIRPIDESILYNGERVLAKHKRPQFSEVATPRVIDPSIEERWAGAVKIAEEFVTPMRLQHVLDKLSPTIGGPMFQNHTPLVLKAMMEDIRAEELPSIEWTNDVPRAINKRTAVLFKQYLDGKNTNA